MRVLLKNNFEGVFMNKTSNAKVNNNFKFLCLCVIAFCLPNHLALFIIFFIKDFPVLYYLNFVSIAIYSISVYFVKKDMFRTFTLLTFFEISINMLLTSILLGWNSGFYFYCIAVLPLAFQCTFLKHKTKLSLAIIESLFFFATLILTKLIYPHYSIGEKNMMIFHTVNAAFCLTAHIFILYFFINTTKSENMVLTDKNKTLQTLADTDPLTGAFNRRFILQKFNEAFDEYQVTGIDFAILLLDIDNFKYINDNYGHVGGDLFLKTTVSSIRNTLRKDDIICRWGGEEILIFLPKTGSSAAAAVGEKIRALIETLVVYQDNMPISTTVTIGVNSCSTSADLNNLINAADRRLYIGKASGKNCVVSDG